MKVLASSEINTLEGQKSDKNKEIENVDKESKDLKSLVEGLSIKNIKAVFEDNYGKNIFELATNVTEMINVVTKFDEDRNKYCNFAYYENNIATWIPELFSNISALAKSFGLSFNDTINKIEGCYYTRIIEEIEGDNYWTLKKIDSYKDYQEKCTNNEKDLLEANRDEIFKNVRGSAYRAIYCDEEKEKFYDKFIKEDIVDISSFDNSEKFYYALQFAKETDFTTTNSVNNQKQILYYISNNTIKQYMEKLFERLYWRR